MLIVGLWTTFNLVIAGVALGVVAERREPDRFPRLAVQRKGTLTTGSGPGGGGGGGGRPIPVEIHSVSAGGCSLRAVAGGAALAGLALEASCSLVVEPLEGRRQQGAMTLQLVHRTAMPDGTSLGFALVDATPAASLALADLMYGDPGAMLRFIQRRRSHMNLLRGMAQFFTWSVTQPVRAFRHLLPTQAKTLPPAGMIATPAPAAAVEMAELALRIAPVEQAEAAATPSAAPMTATETQGSAAPVDALDALAALFDADAAPAFVAPVASVPSTPPVIVPADWMHALLALADKTAKAPDAVVAKSSSSIAA